MRTNTLQKETEMTEILNAVYNIVNICMPFHVEKSQATLAFVLIVVGVCAFVRNDVRRVTTKARQASY